MRVPVNFTGRNGRYVRRVQARAAGFEHPNHRTLQLGGVIPDVLNEPGLSILDTHEEHIPHPYSDWCYARGAKLKIRYP
jgi:hypothetical protein